MSDSTSGQREDVSSILLFLTGISALCLIAGIYLMDWMLVVASLSAALIWGMWSVRHIRMIRKQNAPPPDGDA